MRNISYRKIGKRVVVVGATCGVIGLFALAGVGVALLLRADQQDVVIDYTDTSSIRNAEQQGILSLEQEDIIVLQTGSGQYRIAQLLQNNNSLWSVRRLEYAFHIHEQTLEGVVSISTKTDHLIVVDVQSSQPIQTRNVDFRIQRIDWSIQRVTSAQLRSHGTTIQTSHQPEGVVSYLKTNVQNESQQVVRAIYIGAVAYNAQGTVVGVGSATIPVLSAQEDTEVVMNIGSVSYQDVADVHFYLHGDPFSES